MKVLEKNPLLLFCENYQLSLTRFFFFFSVFSSFFVCACDSKAEQHAD